MKTNFFQSYFSYVDTNLRSLIQSSGSERVHPMSSSKKMKTPLAIIKGPIYKKKRLCWIFLFNSKSLVWYLHLMYFLKVWISIMSCPFCDIREIPSCCYSWGYYGSVYYCWPPWFNLSTLRPIGIRNLSFRIAMAFITKMADSNMQKIEKPMFFSW